jgi:hypothetical protein
MKWLLIWCACLFAVAASAQTPVDMAADPHYHLLLQNDQVRVFRLDLAPTEETFVRYNHSYLFISLQNGELVMWTQGTSAIPHYLFHQGEVEFWLAGVEEGLRNDGPNVFRAVIVDFLNPKVSSYQYNDQGGWNYYGGGINQPVDPHAKFVESMLMGAATTSDVQLLNGDSFPPWPKQADELLIAVSDVDLQGKGDIHVRKSAGTPIWIPSGRTWDLTNASNAPARFTAVAFWKQVN